MAAGFFAGAFLAAGFLAGAFFSSEAAAFLAGAFLAAGFFSAEASSFLAAGFLAGRRDRVPADFRFWGFTALGWVVLLFLWWVNAPETLSILQFVWRGSGL